MSRPAWLVLLILLETYSWRQSLLVRARMPMKVGQKMVAANRVLTIARYIRAFSFGVAWPEAN